MAMGVGARLEDDAEDAERAALLAEDEAVVEEAMRADPSTSSGMVESWRRPSSQAVSLLRSMPRRFTSAPARRPAASSIFAEARSRSFAAMMAASVCGSEGRTAKRASSAVRASPLSAASCRPAIRARFTLSSSDAMRRV